MYRDGKVVAQYTVIERRLRFGGITLRAGKKGFAIYREGKVIEQWLIHHLEGTSTSPRTSLIGMIIAASVAGLSSLRLKSSK